MTRAQRSPVETLSIAAALALFALGCHRGPPRDHTPEGTLSLLRDALVTGSPPPARVVDIRILAEVHALDVAGNLHETRGVPLTDLGFDAALSNAGGDRDMQTAFRGVARMLGQGHCERIGDAPVPDLLRRVPSPGGDWPRRMRETQISVARRALNSIAADFRCDPGLSFGAVFVHPYPDDGTLRVALIGASHHR